MITKNFLDPKDGEVERNPRSTKELEIEKVKLFSESNPRLVRVRKDLPNNFKHKLIELLRKYHECFT